MDEITELQLRNEMELQRTSCLRRMKSDLRLLEEALVALRRPTPKIHVADDHMERVIDSLKDGIRQLTGE